MTTPSGRLLASSTRLSTPTSNPEEETPVDDHDSPGQERYTFHPVLPQFVSIGTSASDGTTIWLSSHTPWCGSTKQASSFYDHQLKRKSEGSLEIIWHDYFKLHDFSGTMREKAKAANLFADHI